MHCFPMLLSSTIMNTLSYEIQKSFYAVYISTAKLLKSISPVFFI